MIEQEYQHKIVAYPDDGKPIQFNWHLPRGTLSKRMSGYELAWVLGKHLPGLLWVMSMQPDVEIEGSVHNRAYRELEAMATQLLTAPREAVDRILPWIRSVHRETEYDIVRLSLFDQTPQPAGTLYFV